MGLKRYQAMRDFAQTPEPKGKKGKKAATASFVIQKHAASRLHYDFRLEMDGVLASWAVPKGPPTAHGDKRLAVHVEDHPLDYAGFEGIIPEGNYGAGTVMVWDRGSYRCEGDPVKAVARGKIDFTLSGKKLKGDWTLVRTRSLNGKDPWLLIKREEDAKAVSKAADDHSAKTGRTMAQIARQHDSVWQSNRKAGKKKTSRGPVAPKATRSKKLPRRNRASSTP